MKHFLLFCGFLFFSLITKAQTSYTWNGVTSTVWNTATNWTPNGIPTSADNVTIVTGSNACILPASQSITNLTITTGTLNLGGNTLTSTGVISTAGGQCNNGTLSGTGTSQTFSGTTFGANININPASTNDVFFNGSTFNGTVTVIKNSGNNTQGTGNNTFNGVTSLTNSGTGYFMMTNGGVGRNEIFNQPVTFNTTNTGNIYVGYSRNATYNANVTVNNTASTGVIFLGGNGGITTLGTGIIINCGVFAGGALNIYKLVQSDATALNLNPGINGGVGIYGASTVTGNLTITAGNVYTQASTFNGVVILNKTGGTNNSSTGGNTFNNTLTMNHSGIGYWGMGNGVADIFNADVFFNNTCANERIIIGQNSTNNQFNGNVNVTESGSAQGIWLGFGGTSPVVTIATGKAINVSSATYTAGYLNLYGFVQTGASPLSYSVATTAGLGIYNSTLNGAITLTGGDIYTQFSTFAANVILNKTGGTSDASSGGNTFNGLLTMNHNGVGYWGMGNGTADIFNSDVYLNNNCANERILIGQNSTNNQFNGNVYVTSGGSAQAIWLGWSGTFPIVKMAAAKNVIAGVAGLTAGGVVFNKFAQSDATAISLTGTGTSYINATGGSVFTGAVNFNAPDVYSQGATYNAPVTFTKTGGGSNHNAGNLNIFNATCTINQQSNTGYFMLGYNANDQFNDNIIVTSTGSGGINLGWSSGSGQPVLANGKTLTVGAAGFSTGYLQLGSFQAGTSPINLNLTGNSIFYVTNANSPCVFGGTVNVTAADLYIRGGTFNGATIFTKTGTVNSNHNNGFQNIFNSTLEIDQVNTNPGAYFMLGYNSNDLFNDNITVTSVGGNINLGYSSGTGTPILAAGKTILVGAAGFTIGQLYLGKFTQLGNAAINLTFTGATGSLVFANSSVIGGNVTSSTPSLFFNGCTFNGTTNCTKTGTASDASSGANVFTGASTLTNTGSGYLILGNGSADIWNGDVTFNNSGSERILPCWNSVGTQFNGNVIVSNTGAGVGIEFCGGSTASTCVVAATKNIQIGAAGYNTGYLHLYRFTQLGSAASNLTLTGASTVINIGPSSAIGGNFTVVSPRILLNGAVYSGNVNLTKNGATGEWSTGGNTFNGTTTVNQLGAGYFGFANGAIDIYNGDLYANNNSTERIIFGNSPVGNQFNGNIILTQIGSSVGTAFGWNATTNETMAAGKTISIGAAGFNVGYLQIAQFTQLGNVAVNLPLTGTSSLTYGPNSALGGNVTSTSASLFFSGCTFNGTSDCTKNGATADASVGGNIYNGACTITNSGSGYLILGNNTLDIWNNDVTFTDNGSERLLPCWATAGNQFNGNITLNTAGSAQGIQFCGGNAVATATQAAAKTIQSGAIGLNAGYLIFKQFTQLGNAPVNLTLTSTATYLQFGPISVFGGNITSSSPGLFFNGCTFSGSVNSTKTGASNDGSVGNNIFNGVTTITNAGAGYLQLGNGSLDQFNTTSTFNNTGSNTIYVADNSANNIFGGVATFNNTPTANTLINVSRQSTGTVFNNNIVVTSNNGQGVQFCGGNATATATLSAGNTITIGAGGFSAGTLLLKQFTQAGATPQNLTLTGTGNLTFGPTSAFGGNVTTVSPTLFFNGCTYSGTVISTKNGGTNDGSVGGNIYNGPFTITNTGAGYFLMGNGNPDIWQSTATFNNLSTGQHMYTAYNCVGTIFNGNVIYNNQPTSNGLLIYPNNTGVNTQFNGNISLINVNGGGIYFGNGAGTATLATGSTVSVGAGGFNFGALIFKNFTQTGSTAQSITTTGASNIQYASGTTFNGNLTSVSPGLFFNGATFNATVSGTKNGSTNDASAGANTFNGSSTFSNSGTGYLLMTNTTPDAYNNDVAFVQNSTGLVYPNYNGNSTYLGNVTVTSPVGTTMVFGSNTGTATFGGGNSQMFNIGNGTTPFPTLTRMVMNKSANALTLNTRINISSSLTMTLGNINTTSVNILNMNNGTTTTIGNSNSYINGPMNYDMAFTGARTLNFPIGKLADWRPAILNLTHSAATAYTYNGEIFDAPAPTTWTFPSTIDTVSGVHYWTINRYTTGTTTSVPSTGLSGNQIITLYFDVNDKVYDGANLTIVKNTAAAPTAWIDIGGTGGPPALGGVALAGSVTSTSAPSAFNSFSTFTLGSKIGIWNPLPVEMLYFTAKPVDEHVELDWATATEVNNSKFEIERSKNGTDFEYVTAVNAHGNGNSTQTQTYQTFDSKPYNGNSYYRLKQIDKNGAFKYTNIVQVNFDKKSFVAVYPNPAVNSILVNVSSDYDNATVKIMDALGREVLSQNISSAIVNTINATTLESGMYYVIISNGTDVTKTKITIQK